MLEQQLLAEFDRRLRAETAEKLAEADASSPLDQAAALAEVMVGYLEEAGAVSEHEPLKLTLFGGAPHVFAGGFIDAPHPSALLT